MEELLLGLHLIDTDPQISKDDILDDVIGRTKSAGYEIVEINREKPWGAYIRISNDAADRFVTEFFQGLSLEGARLGNEDAQLSPKFLIVAPEQRLSWQYHDRRAERWVFLTSGGYHKSTSDDQGDVVHVKGGDVVQFEQGERHRLIGLSDGYTVVAEIWQHSDPNLLSDEEDIVRLADDYSR